MAGGFHIYFEAARTLWDMSTGRLETMARDAKSAAERRAAALTLDLKRDLITPGEFGDERNSLTKLASSLLEDQQFTMEMALQMAPKKTRRPAATLVQSGGGGHKPRHTVLWVAITAGVLLLIMDVLATAGVPVPTPIGEILDHVTGEDESPVAPAPQPPRPDRARRGGGPVVGEPANTVPKGKSRPALRSDAPDDGAQTGMSEPTSAGSAVPSTGKKAHQARGKKAHQAQGKKAHQARGKKAHQARGRAENQPSARGNEKAESATSRGKARGHDENRARSTRDPGRS